MPRFQLLHSESEISSSNELSSAEIRAQLEVLISEYENARSKTEQGLVSGILLSFNSFITYIYELTFLINLFMLYLDNLISYSLSKKNNSQENPIYSLLLAIIIIVYISYFLAPLMINTLQRCLRSLLSSVAPQYLEHIKAIAQNPAAEMQELKNSLTTFEPQVMRFCKLANLLSLTPPFYLMGSILNLILTIHYYIDNYAQVKQNGRGEIIEITSLLLLTSPLIKEWVTFRKLRKQQTHVESYNISLIDGLIQNLEKITLKKGSSKTVSSYIGLLFKISDFKSMQLLKINNKEYNLSYKDVFDGMLYCISLVDSMKVVKLDKHSIIISADINKNTHYTNHELRQKLLIFLENKHNINLLKGKILNELKNTTSSLDCYWQAVEKKEQGLPYITFIADLGHLNIQQHEILTSGLISIYGERIKIQNHEIIIEPTVRNDICSGYKRLYRDLKEKLEGRAATKILQKRHNDPSQAHSTFHFGENITGYKNPSKPIAPNLTSFTQIITDHTITNSPTIKWANGVTYIHETEIRKGEDDDTRIIPLPCGRNDVMRYNRFLIIDPKLKDKINDPDLYKRYRGCFWKSVGPVNQQGRKRVITAYEGCDGKQHISEWEVKIPRTDPRVYIRILDQNNPNAILYTADGWHPHPHKK